MGSNLTIAKLDSLMEKMREPVKYQQPVFYTNRITVNKMKYILYRQLLKKQDPRFRNKLLYKTNKRYKFKRGANFNDWNDPTSKAYNPGYQVMGQKFHISDIVTEGNILCLTQ